MKPSLVSLLCLAYLFYPFCVYASGDEPPEITELVTVFVKVLNAFYALVFILGALFIIISGIKWATAGGDPKAVADAQRTLTFTLLGLIAAVAAGFLVRLLGNLIGADLSKISLPGP